MPPTRAPLLPSLVLLLATAGCPSGGVPLRADGSPGAETCAEEALRAMRILRMHVGDSAGVELDANETDASLILLREGPVVSRLVNELGDLPPGTRLSGRVWTGGPLVVVRYYQAKPPDGDTVPLCAVARLGRGQLRKLPESKPGTALLDYSGASVFVVDSFR